MVYIVGKMKTGLIGDLNQRANGLILFACQLNLVRIGLVLEPEPLEDFDNFPVEGFMEVSCTSLDF